MRNSPIVCNYGVRFDLAAAAQAIGGDTSERCKKFKGLPDAVFARSSGNEASRRASELLRVPFVAMTLDG